MITAQSVPHSAGGRGLPEKPCGTPLQLNGVCACQRLQGTNHSSTGHPPVCTSELLH